MKLFFQVAAGIVISYFALIAIQWFIADQQRQAQLEQLKQTAEYYSKLCNDPRFTNAKRLEACGKAAEASINYAFPSP